MRKILLFYLFRRNLAGCLNACYGVSYLLCSLVTARSVLVDVHSFSWWRQFHLKNPTGLQEAMSSLTKVSESMISSPVLMGAPFYTTVSNLSLGGRTNLYSQSQTLEMMKSNFIDNCHDIPIVESPANNGDLECDHVQLDFNSRHCTTFDTHSCPQSLQPAASCHQVDVEKKKEAEKSLRNDSSNKQKSPYYTFHHPMSNTTLYGFGISLPQFKSWVRYKLESSFRHKDNATVQSNDIMNFISTDMIDVSESIARDGLRTKWVARKLLVDKTDVFSKFSSCRNVELENKILCGNKEEESLANKNKHDRIVLEKGGKFEDLLKLYVHRLIDILRDEIVDGAPDDEKFSLVEWLENSYDSEKVDQLKEANFRKLTLAEKKEAMMQLLVWFRTMFPYYYDKCEHCGISYRNDMTSGLTERNEHEVCSEGIDKEMATNDQLEEDSLPEGPFLGYCYPEPHEQLGRAARTEMFECRRCGGYTRFPRYNSVKHIVDSRRGRCGEYSILLYRMLRALGHESRWVVDWADHVWVECWMDGQWIHLDPCEAAIDRPLLYEEWGKKQTYIIAFWAPLRRGEVHTVQDYISDVTFRYTSDEITAIYKRRNLEKEVVDDIMKKSSSLLCSQLNNISP